MPPHSDFAEHIKFWFTLGDKVVDAIILWEPNILERGNNSMKLTKDQENEVLSRLSKYCEVDRADMETFFHPEDISALQDHANQLILWTQSARKEFMEIQKKNRVLEKEQRQNEDDNRARGVLLDAMEEMELQRNKKILALELRARAMLSLVKGLNQQREARNSQTPDTAVTEKEYYDTGLTIEPPQDSCHFTNDTESEPSSIQVELDIARISSGITSLAGVRNVFETRLRLLRENIENDNGPSRPSQIRPVEITPEDIHKTVTSIVESNSKVIIRGILCDLFEAIEDGHRNLALKLHDGLEMPLRTIELQIKRCKINSAAIVQEF